MWNSYLFKVTSDWNFLVFCLSALTGLIIIFRICAARNLPPGPPGNILIGHVLKIPLDYQWKLFAKWAKQYGDVLYIHILGRPMIICNSFELAKELMEKRSSNYSDRPPQPAPQLLGWGSLIAVLGYGERWKKQRRIMQKSFDQQTSKSFQPATQDELNKFIKGIMHFDGDLSKKIHRFVAGTISLAAYGHEVTTEDDELVTNMDEVSHVTNASGSPGSTPVDLFPILQYLPTWLPGMHFMKLLREGSVVTRKALTIPVDLIRKDREAGVARKSFLAELLDDYETKRIYDKEHEEDIAALGGIIFIGGAETTEFSLYVFFLMMVLRPEVAELARIELDNFMQAEKRLPSFKERGCFPYINSIIKEVYRINPAFPLCIPHRCMEKDTYQGLTIPGGSTIVPNIWQMMRDEKYYVEPDKFLPERFLDLGKNNLLPHPDDPASDPSKIVFGFGRRACPGRFFADDIIWLTVATVLSVYDILPSIDPSTGYPVRPTMEFTSGPMTTAKPFTCRIVPPSDKHKVIVTDLVV